MKKSRRKMLVIVLVVLAILGGALYWYASYQGWFDNYGPDNLPTAEERQRMEEVERESAKIAPDAKAGAGVFLKGTLPPKVVPETASTSAASTTVETRTDTATTS